MVQMIKVAHASDLPPGKTMLVEAGGEAIALFNIDGSYHAIGNTCTHQIGRAHV